MFSFFIIKITIIRTSTKYQNIFVRFNKIYFVGLLYVCNIVKLITFSANSKSNEETKAFPEMPDFVNSLRHIYVAFQLRVCVLLLKYLKTYNMA